jgi:hypothetical protein
MLFCTIWISRFQWVCAIFLATETQFQQHAKELAKSFNLSEIDGIVCVSGDGVLVEVYFHSYNPICDSAAGQ